MTAETIGNVIPETNTNVSQPSLGESKHFFGGVSSHVLLIYQRLAQQLCLLKVLW